ncbi:MAG TPA: 6-phosphogluconolactonase [Candidatus Bathyarchaeia archaeon]|nr:6-phosphogluconolactonase [Candidatus Bathyarchaeia archaeon]HKM77460.1 6-phosphogluconolactonase [Candidatus Bathyarchaeia archaeon]
MSPDVRTFSDIQSLTERVAQNMKDSINQTDRSGQYFLALAGGNTPRALYQLLAENYADKIDWTNVQLFWGDERYVSTSDSRSNFRMVQETLLRHVPIPTKQVHPMPTNYQDPNDAAHAYEITLRKYFHSNWPRFNLMILGLGSDGHTASIFPGSISSQDKRWVVATQAPTEPKQRLTLTLPVLSNSERVFFIVTGSDKANALERTLTHDVEVQCCPAAGVYQKNAAVIFWTDKDASKLLRLT